MTQTPTPTEPKHRDAAADAAEGDAALLKLHKMSRTAGLGMTDYVAINSFAVASLLFGVASPLLIIFGWTLVIVPLTAMVLAIVALRQISNSNGTQTGRMPAITAIIVALMCAGFYGIREFNHARITAGEEARVEQVIDQLGKDWSARNYEDSYKLFSSRFKERWPYPKFETQIKSILDHPGVLGVKSMVTNGRYVFEDTEGDAMASTTVVVTLVKNEQINRPMTRLRKVDESWFIEDMQFYFPPPEPTSTPPPGSAPPTPNAGPAAQ